MSSLHLFQDLSQDLFFKPFFFWSTAQQQEHISGTASAVQSLREALEEKGLADTSAYRILGDLRNILSANSFDELAFIQQLGSLAEIYKLSSPGTPQEKLVKQLENSVNQAKQKLLEYHVGLEILAEKAKTLAAEKQAQKDFETLQTIGIFYILEYTVYVLYLLSKSDVQQKKQLFYEGLKTPEANLPPYTVFGDSFRRDLCLQVYNPELRDSLLRAFFTFEEVFQTGNLATICPAFKQFNLDLLRLFQLQGVTQFKTVFLSPFGKNPSLGEVVQQVEQLSI